MKILLDVKLAVKCNDHIRELFQADTGAPRGDCASSTEFIFYLARSLKFNEQFNARSHNCCKKTLADGEHSHNIKQQLNYIALDFEYVDYQKFNEKFSQNAT